MNNGKEKARCHQRQAEVFEECANVCGSQSGFPAKIGDLQNSAPVKKLSGGLEHDLLVIRKSAMKLTDNL